MVRHDLSFMGAWAVLCAGSGLVAMTHAAPVVSHVTARQRLDKRVDIHYDLADDNNAACTVTVNVSHDAGATWSVPVTAVTGDVGPGITPGADKLIVWDSPLDLPGAFGSQFKIRVAADDGQNQPPEVSNLQTSGGLSQGEQGTIAFSCTAMDPDGLVESVTVDLSAVGGSTVESLHKNTADPCSRDAWFGSFSVTPPRAGPQTVTLTVTDLRSASVSVQILIDVAPPGAVPIPAGEFRMGDPFYPSFREGNTDEHPPHRVQVNAYFMDRYEVTNQQYAVALNWALGQGGLITVTKGVVYPAAAGATAYPYCDTTANSAYSRITWDGNSFGVTPGKERHPMVMVSWYGAVAYANWRSVILGKSPCYDLSTWTCTWSNGYRLPTEAEWERAARGGVDGHRFPWSDTDTIDQSRANYYSSNSDAYDLGPTIGFHPLWNGGVLPFTDPVGFFTGALQQQADWGWPGLPTSFQTSDGANGYGLYDLAGNVSEWCNDWYSPSYYSTSPYSNPRGPESGTNRVFRGGPYGGAANQQRCASRGNNLPTYRVITHGFRLVIGHDE